MLRGSPRLTARVAGLFELLEGSTSLLGQQVIPGMVIVGRDAAATANNIVANETLFRMAIVLSLCSVVFHIAWGLLLYQILRVVDRTLSLFSVFMLVVGSALLGITALLLLAPLVVLRNSDALAAFTSDQLAALALVFLRLNTQANNVFLAFFGVWLVTIGFLVFRSTFLPRLIGIGLMLEGLGWVAYMWPPLGAALFPVTAVFGIFGELPLTAWLLIKGVNTERWQARALASGDVGVGDPG